ncbi:MAG: twin-arginine translocation signal domain-containing protein, partial [Anaerolineae bacterium]
MKRDFSRRDFLKAGAAGVTTYAGGAALLGMASPHQETVRSQSTDEGHTEHNHTGMGTAGQVNHAANGFDPTVLLTGFDYGQVSQLDNGQTLREYTFVAVDK